MTKKTLSDKIYIPLINGSPKLDMCSKDVKEFIKDLKRKLIEKYSTEPNLRIDRRDWDFIIDELVGDKLI